MKYRLVAATTDGLLPLKMGENITVGDFGDPFLSRAHHRLYAMIFPKPAIKLVTSSDRVVADRFSELTVAATRGDPSATRTLLASVMPSLIQVVRRVLGTRNPDVEDVVQEAATSFVRALPAFRAECTVLHFASRVALSCALMHRRRAKSRISEVSDIDGDAGVANDPSPPEAVIAARHRQILRMLCDELPEAQVEVLALHCMLGMTVEEVAAVASVPLNTVRSRLRVAKETLRDRVFADPVLADELGVER